ncbi:MAG: ABC transporter permease [Spartobacteria bacterium]|nr:ABC transporter permease [Spartobacteria bacterium]
MKRQTKSEIRLSFIPLVWLCIFFAIPTVAIFIIAFKKADPYGNLAAGWTLSNISSLVNAQYPPIIWRTVWLSFVTTMICLAAALPVGWYMAKAGARWRNLLMLLIILPFWTNFLIRIFAWKMLLHPEGMLRHGLLLFHLIEPTTQLMYHAGAVLVVLVYTYLPFAILPIYAAAEKFDFSLIEAAHDLGAGRLRAYWMVFIPGIRNGIFTASAMVFIPTLGSYIIPDIMGGSASEMIGNKIAQRALINRNLPESSLLSALLALSVLVPTLVVIYMKHKRDMDHTLRVKGVR